MNPIFNPDRYAYNYQDEVNPAKGISGDNLEFTLQLYQEQFPNHLVVLSPDHSVIHRYYNGDLIQTLIRIFPDEDSIPSELVNQ